MKAKSNVEDLIEKTSDWSNMNAAIDACIDFIEYHKDDPRLLDIQATIGILQTYENLGELINDKFPDFNGQVIYQNNLDRQELFGNGIHAVLANGIVTSDKIKDKLKRENAKKFLLGLQNIGAKQLFKFFDVAQKELESFLVEGKAKSLVKKVTIEDAYEDAGIYYNAYLEGDIEGALQGMSYLKNLNPYDSYFRNFMGVLFETKGEHERAIQEYLIGIQQDPEDPKIMYNLMNQLSLISLHPLILELWVYYKEKGKPGKDQNVDLEIQRIVTVSKICTMGLLSKFLKITEEDISSEEESLFNELVIADRPWFKN